MNFDAIIDFITLQSEQVPENVRGASQLSARRSLEIYRKDYLARLQEVLILTYPITWQILGDEVFYNRAHQYVAQNPSRHWDINFYGEDFATFLEQTPITELPFITEIAKLEWTSHQLFHDEEETRAISQLPQDEGQLGALQLSPHLKFFSSPYQIASIYRAAQQEFDHIPLGWNSSSFYYLFKRNHLVQLDDLNQTEFQILTTWREVGSLAHLLTALDSDSKEQEQVATTLGPLLLKIKDALFLVNYSSVHKQCF